MRSIIQSKAKLFLCTELNYPIFCHHIDKIGRAVSAQKGLSVLLKDGLLFLYELNRYKTVIGVV